MTKDELKLRIKIAIEIMRVTFHLILKPALYMIVMWMFEVAAAFLFFKDLWTAAGFISAISLYRITQAEFNKEFFGARNAVQK